MASKTSPKTTRVRTHYDLSWETLMKAYQASNSYGELASKLSTELGQTVPKAVVQAKVNRLRKVYEDQKRDWPFRNLGREPINLDALNEIATVQAK